jgi:triacylglycerol lipase
MRSSSLWQESRRSLSLPISQRAFVLQQLHANATSATFSTGRRALVDPRLKELGNIIEDEFTVLRKHYDAPRNPIILAHGLLGFDTMHLVGHQLPGIQYWRGIREALSEAGVEVITATVPPSGCIERRAERLAETIRMKAKGRSVNIIAYEYCGYILASLTMYSHSMGGLDSRYMLSQLRPQDVDVLSLTTIATPHRGSAFADYLFDALGRKKFLNT